VRLSPYLVGSVLIPDSVRTDTGTCRELCVCVCATYYGSGSLVASMWCRWKMLEPLGSGATGNTPLKGILGRWPLLCLFSKSP
jgi:hypothetical protein